MTSLSDTLTVGLVLVLLFGSITLYLYTRIQQAEQKISLLESILLDLKMSAEIKSFSELPADSIGGVIEPVSNASYVPFDEENTQEKEDVEEYYSSSSMDNVTTKTSSDSSVLNTNILEVDEYKSVIADAVSKNNDESDVKDDKVSVNYEAMTLKELQTLAKTRGITGASSMKKGSIIEALKTSDRSSSNIIEPGSTSNTSLSFLETSSPFQGSAESE